MFCRTVPPPSAIFPMKTTHPLSFMEVYRLMDVMFLSKASRTPVCAITFGVLNRILGGPGLSSERAWAGFSGSSKSLYSSPLLRPSRSASSVASEGSSGFSMAPCSNSYWSSIPSPSESKGSLTGTRVTRKNVLDESIRFLMKNRMFPVCPAAIWAERKIGSSTAALSSRMK